MRLLPKAATSVPLGSKYIQPRSWLWLRPSQTLLAEIADHLLDAHGQRFVPSVLWRFFNRRATTFKKNRTRQRTRAGRRGGAAQRMAGSSA